MMKKWSSMGAPVMRIELKDEQELFENGIGRILCVLTINLINDSFVIMNNCYLLIL